MVESIVPNFTSGVQKMMESMVGQGGFGPATLSLYEDLGEAAEDYQEDMDEI
jgi:hypothetical protein